MLTLAASAAAGTVGYQFARGALRLSGPVWLRHSTWVDDAPTLLIVLGFLVALPMSRASARSLYRARRTAQLASLTFLAVPLLWPKLAHNAVGSILVVPVALALPLMLGVTLFRSTTSATVPFLARGTLTWALEPTRVLAGFSALVLLVVAASSYGGVYGSMIVAMSYGCLSLLLAQLEQVTGECSVWGSPTLRASAVTACSFTVWLAHASSDTGALHSMYPSRLFLTYGDHNTQHVVVYDAPAGPELFIDGKLEASALDGDRLARTLAALVPPSAKRILVLGTGSGVVQKAIADRVAFEALTTIAPSSNVAQLADQIPWLTERSLRHDPRLTLLVDEPYAWLEQTDQLFDAIVCNLPPPLSHRDGKHYTTHFISTLTARLTPAGRAYLHGLSPRLTPLAHQTLLATAGPAVALVHAVSVPSVGDWTLIELQRPQRPIEFASGGSTLATPQATYLFMSDM